VLFMSEPNAECPGCKVLKTEVALLKAEVAGRDAVIAELTERPGRDARELVIRGLNRPARLTLAGPRGADAEDVSYRVSLEDWNLSAASLVSGIDPVQFLACFEDLARQAAGWEGRKAVASGDGDFSISWEYQGFHYHPEVWAHVRLANDWHEPLWAVELRLESRPEALAALAQQARAFFAKD
jgi:hypothetical protein